MKSLSLEQIQKISGGRKFENVQGVCSGLQAGAIMYDFGIAFLGWTPVGWACLAFSAAGLACMAAGY